MGPHKPSHHLGINSAFEPVSLCSLGGPPTHDPAVSTSPVKGSQACTQYSWPTLLVLQCSCYSLTSRVKSMQASPVWCLHMALTLARTQPIPFSCNQTSSLISLVTQRPVLVSEFWVMGLNFLLYLLLIYCNRCCKDPFAVFFPS